MSSIHGFVSEKMWTSASVLQGGVHMVTKTLANDWGKYDITNVAALHPATSSELTQVTLIQTLCCDAQRHC